MTTKASSPRPSKKPAYKRQTRELALQGGALASLLWQKFLAECPPHLSVFAQTALTLRKMEDSIWPDKADLPREVEHGDLLKSFNFASKLLVGEDGSRGTH